MDSSSSSKSKDVSICIHNEELASSIFAVEMVTVFETDSLNVLNETQKYQNTQDTNSGNSGKKKSQQILTLKNHKISQYIYK